MTSPIGAGPAGGASNAFQTLSEQVISKANLDGDVKGLNTGELSRLVGGEQADKWMQKFDANKDGKLDQEEISKLLEEALAGKQAAPQPQESNAAGKGGDGGDKASGAPAAQGAGGAGKQEGMDDLLKKLFLAMAVDDLRKKGEEFRKNLKKAVEHGPISQETAKGMGINETQFKALDTNGDSQLSASEVAPVTDGGGSIGSDVSGMSVGMSPA